jgi:hypothetical protein
MCMFPRRLTSGPSWACKTCGQAATVWQQCSANPVDHVQGNATVPGGATGQSHVAGWAWHGTTTRQGTLHKSPRPSLSIPSNKNPITVIGFQPPRDHLLGRGAQCNCPSLTYKRTRHAPILDNLNSTQVQLSLEQHDTHNNTTLSLVGVGYYASVAQIT